MESEPEYKISFVASEPDETKELLKRIEALEAENKELKSKLASAEVFRLSKVATIERRGENKWAVCSLNETLNKVTKEWEYEPFPSSRDDRYLSENRFDTYEEAKKAFYELQITDK